ncbi:MAG TPA: hypothetical protein VMT12_15775 [Syntrophales bacterium]|nr:hypothetical protein [Syntrophales bacterium]
MMLIGIAADHGGFELKMQLTAPSTTMRWLRDQSHLPQSDFYLCTELGRFNFVLKACYCDEGLIRLN